MKKSLFILVLAGLISGILCSQQAFAAAGENLTAAPEVAAGTPADQTVAPEKTPKVVYNPKEQRDPTLSQDDELLLDQQRKSHEAALEKYQKCLAAKEEAEKEQEKQERKYQLCLLKHPEAEVADRIWMDGIIEKEVLIGDKVYGVGSTYLNAKIVAIKPASESVVFSYKGATFTKKVGAKKRKAICKRAKPMKEFNCKLDK